MTRVQLESKKQPASSSLFAALYVLLCQNRMESEVMEYKHMHPLNNTTCLLDFVHCYFTRDIRLVSSTRRA